MSAGTLDRTESGSEEGCSSGGIFHRRYVDKAELWGTGIDPGRYCTPETACPLAVPPGQGCLPSLPW